MKLTRLCLALVTALALPAATACATRPAPNVMMLYYAAGNLENRQFVQCIHPGTDGKYAIDDEIFTILADRRTWNVAPEGGDSNTPYTSGTAYGSDGQPGPAVKTWVASDFWINTDCTGGKDSPVVRFWEDLGRSKGISVDNDEYGWVPDKWRELLQSTLVVVQQKVIAEGTRWYLADDLDSNGHGERAEMEKRIGPLFQAELRAKLGGNYFCGAGFRIDSGTHRPVEVEYEEYLPDGTEDTAEPLDPAKPEGPKRQRMKFKVEKKRSTCPPVRISITDVDFANQAIADARAEVYAAKQRAQAKLIDAQAELDKSIKLAQAAQNGAYLQYKEIEAKYKAAEACAANANCTVIIDGTGSAGINVGTKR